MFGIGRRKTRGQRARVELNQGVSHLMQAAAYAAKGAGDTVGPRVQAARGAVAPTATVVRARTASGFGATVAALAPLAGAVRNAQAGTAGRAAAAKQAAVGRKIAVANRARAKNAKAKAKAKSGRAAGMMTGLLVAGTVAGLAGALAMRRRREQQEWAEYDPTRTLDPIRDEVETLEVRTPPTSAVAGGDSASTTPAAAQPVIHPTDQVPSVAGDARDVSGRPADDSTEALGEGARSSGRR